MVISLQTILRPFLTWSPLHKALVSCPDASLGVAVHVCRTPDSAHVQCLCLSLCSLFLSHGLQFAHRLGNVALYKSLLSCYFAYFPGAQYPRRIMGATGRKNPAFASLQPQFASGSLQGPSTHG